MRYTQQLFEVLKKMEYIYQGVVELCGDPYQEKQKDEDGLEYSAQLEPVNISDRATRYDVWSHLI